MSGGGGVPAPSGHLGIRLHPSQSWVRTLWSPGTGRFEFGWGRFKLDLICVAFSFSFAFMRFFFMFLLVLSVSSEKILCGISVDIYARCLPNVDGYGDE